ncbi:MAG: chromate transporter [Spirochaetaceae bacterium]|jgi:chromate transporter|nr:chromate transporter [Spirochaetaceae bacterium]
MNILLIYIEFAAIGLFSIGGGLSTLPFIYRLAGKYAWFDVSEIPDMLAAAQFVPGAIGVNFGAYAGLRAAGIAGAFFAVAGLLTGPIVVIIVIAHFYDEFKKNRTVQNVFEGLRPAAAGLLAVAGYGIVKLALFRTGAPDIPHIFKFRECIIFIVFYILMARYKKLSAAIFIAAGAAAGIILRLQ